MLALSLTLCLSSCYDDSALWDSIKDHESRISALEELCNKMNTNISSLQTIVEALQNNEYVTATAPITENGKEIGYTITFTSGKSITIYHGKDGKDGQNGKDGVDGKDGKDGKDGHTPVIGVKKDVDGFYYWTLDGEWLLDDTNNKIKAIGQDGKDGQNGKDGVDGQDGITPKLKIEEEYWYVSYDNGYSWHQLGKAIDDSGYTFQNIVCDEKGLHITLADGTELTLPIKAELQLLLSSYSLKCVEGGEYKVGYCIVGAEDKVVVTTMSEGGYTTSISRTDDKSGEVIIKINNDAISGKVLVFLTSGTQTVVQTIDVFLTDDVASLNQESANSYIVSKSGTYSFPTVKGNSNIPVGFVNSAEVLWESYGNATTPKVGALIKSVSYSDGYISYTTTDTFSEGNAVIAAKDVSGEILWSWHIWFTDEPQGQVYLNNAGVMMDRNLGATSATPGSVGALGLMYQWGRKDPFLGSSSITNEVVAKSTASWPSPVASSSTEGTIDYAVKHPMTFITGSDWCYIGDNTLWQSEKTIYDPCPVGWRVPDGGSEGVWENAGFPSKNKYDTNEGMKFNVADAGNAWYPAAGLLTYKAGEIGSVAYSGTYWSATLKGTNPYALYFSSYGSVYFTYTNSKGFAFSVRCVQDNPNLEVPIEPESVNLSEKGTANSYIVSEAGSYKFVPTKGGSSESVGAIATAEVLWETFGTDVAPAIGDLVKNVKYENGVVSFETPSTFKEGNAVIAAKDASGTILWSWHVWLTDQPEGQEYYNNAGTMMDRNLGATSATPGDVGALGLLYQWGRKDPFLGSSSISSSTLAKSTITWPSAVESNSSNGTIAYATANPTTFIKYNSSNYDWYYTGSSSTDITRWTTSDNNKSIYDPCPVGWRVPDGGGNGEWSKALGSSSYFDYTYDSTNEGMDFSDKCGSASTIWYPASGCRDNRGGSLSGVGYNGFCWSASPSSIGAYGLYFDFDGRVGPSSSYFRADGQSVRCLQE